MGKSLKLSDQNKPWARDLAARKQGTTPKRRFFLIVCEGTKTEPNYFEGLKKELPKGVLHIVIKGEGKNTLSLVEQALAHKKAQQQFGPVDKVWVVFDRDSFEPADFDNAIKKAASQNVGAAWSNEAFELWYLLHFEDRQTCMRRSDYEEKLTKYLGKTYKKNDVEMYVALKDRISEARKRAKGLDKHHSQAKSPPHQSNPCTQVHKLVEALHNLRPHKPSTKKMKGKKKK